MQNNKLRMAIRATAAVTVLGLASQAQAFSFSAGDVDADMYGYVRANFAYDIDEEVADDSASGAFPTGSDVDGHFNASAQQSRVGIKATNSDGVMINVEGDFYGGDFRLRHAYGSYQGILAGQTWSNFNSFVGVTPSVDFSGAAGLAGLQGRATQLRYTTGPMSFALEEPKARADASGGAVDGRTDEKEGMPALTARLEDSSGNLSYSVAGVVKQTAYDDGIDDDESTIGYGVFGAGKVKLSDMISIQGSMTYTDGANEYNFRSDDADAWDDNGDLENISTIGGVIGTTIGLGQGRSVNIQHGMVKNDTDDRAATTAETNQTTFVNYMWKPADSVTMGAEYQYWKTETEGGESEDANRVMFMAQYNF